MYRSWLALSVFVSLGCAQPTIVETPDTSHVSRNFKVLPLILSGIKVGDVSLYEGLPSQFWEPQLREQELRKLKETTEIHGHPVYTDLLVLDDTSAQQLTVLFSDQNSFREYHGDKQCGGYNADFCLEWNSDEGATFALISLECGEIEFFSPKADLHCDLSNEARQQLRQLLSGYSKNRPDKKSSS